MNWIITYCLLTKISSFQLIYIQILLYQEFSNSFLTFYTVYSKIEIIYSLIIQFLIILSRMNIQYILYIPISSSFSYYNNSILTKQIRFDSIRFDSIRFDSILSLFICSINLYTSATFFIYFNQNKLCKSKIDFNKVNLKVKGGGGKRKEKVIVFSFYSKNYSLVMYIRETNSSTKAGRMYLENTNSSTNSPRNANEI